MENALSDPHVIGADVNKQHVPEPQSISCQSIAIQGTTVTSFMKCRKGQDMVPSMKELLLYLQLPENQRFSKKSKITSQMLRVPGDLLEARILQKNFY